jgi:Spy/CpxP family protein refolding chaperone
MSITKDIKMPALPLALGLVLSTTIALQPAALPSLAQEAPFIQESFEDSVPAQMGGVMAFSGGDIEVMVPQFAGVLAPPTEDAFNLEHGGPGGGEHHHHGFSEANKMTDDQHERMYAIREDVQDQMGLKMAQERILHRKLRDTLSAANIDTKQAQDLANKITALKSDMTQLKLDSMIKMAQVFTPGQRQELHLMMIKGHHHHGGRGHHHWGHGGHEGHGGPGGHGGHEGPGGHEGHEGNFKAQARV